MLDPKLIRENPDAVRKALSDRKTDATLVDRFLEKDAAWRRINFELEELKAKQNKVSEQIAALKKEKVNADQLLSEMKDLSTKIKGIDERARAAEQETVGVALIIPNIPNSSVVAGTDASCNKELRRSGQQPKFDFKPRPHWEIGEALGILDLKAAAKTSGSRFATLFGAGAALERALISFMLETHINEGGYREVLAPYMVKKESMEGTGQLPKFEEELYKCKDDELYLIPTAEVSITNIHREEVLKEASLPVKYCSYSACFRREAGSYGKDVKGLIRVHQFNKVELIKFAHPLKSYEELEKLTADAESILGKLGLHYRVVMLCTGDLGFSSAKTYDIEVWFPSEGKFREISSCSNFEAFQARRANIKYKPADVGKLEYVHTLNGSGLAVGRTFAAVLENYQQADGSVVVPEPLRKYMGGLEVIKTPS
jgi:seryl-tRNA synthetase